MKQLDITEDMSVTIAKKGKLLKTDVDTLKAAFSFLKSFGYSKEDILTHPNILKKTRRKLQEERLVLEEAGFSDLSLWTLSHFRKLMTKSIRTLKGLNLIPPQVNVPRQLVSYVNPKPSDFDVSNYTDGDILNQVHGMVVKQYLEWRLEATSDEIETLFRVYRGTLRYKSIRWLCENIEFALELGFTPRKLLGFGYLLSNDPNIPKEVLKEMPTLAGVDMRVMMRRFPKLVTISLKHYLKIYDILKEEGIPDSTIRKQMNIFSLSPLTIKARFNELKEVPEMNVLRQSPRILRLILHYNRAKSRLSFMHQLQLKCATMCLLVAEHDSEPHFNHHVRNTKDMNVLNDILTLLKHMLNTDTPAIEYNLKKHPFYLQIPLVNIEKTCKHVQKSFSNHSIIKVLPILLYPSEKIDDALNQIKSLTDLPQTRLTEAKRLNLALYLIEKNYHFSGDGVWENCETVEN
ncbi:hypothetical protein Trydic_g14790 [Trypoxylus dichotomus]